MIATTTRGEFTFFHELRVRWAEIDSQQVVFNANYYVYFDVAITEYWRAIGLAYPQDLVDKFGTDLYAVRSSAEYHGSARYDEILSIGCRTARIGRTSLQLVLGIWRGGEHLTSGELVYVNVDPKVNKPMPLPEPLKALVLGYERVAPALAQPV